MFISLDAENFAAQADLHVALFAFREQQIDDLLRRIITKQLAERLLMPGDAIFADQLDKVPLGVARQGRFAKMRVLAQIGRRLNIHVGKVAAAAAGHQNFSSRLFAVIEQQDAAAELARLRCAKHSRRSGANDNGIKPFHTAFLVPQLSGFVNISLWSHQREKSRIRYIIERYRITPNRVKPKQEENQKKSIFHFARAAKVTDNAPRSCPQNGVTSYATFICRSGFTYRTIIIACFSFCTVLRSD
ncbi:hypothetical protein BN1007_10300 [Klebsiella variicola]|nr:hypothetical protein BN1007_10300 [Klebsiella variicola]